MLVKLCSSAGFIDMHVHMTGGGGEAGPASRCPEAQVRSSAADCLADKLQAKLS